MILRIAALAVATLRGGMSATSSAGSSAGFDECESFFSEKSQNAGLAAE
jgi:hypothetical protein